MKRKERVDKKREVKPLIPLETKDNIHRLSHVTFTPVKDVCEFLVTYLIQDKNVINELSKYFKREVVFYSTMYRGHINAPSIPKRLKVDAELVSVKFTKTDYEIIAAIAYALDVTPTRTTAILLEMATRNVKVVNEYVRLYMVEELTDSQIKELRRLLSYVNRYNEDNSSWLTVLSVIVGSIRPATKKLRELVEEFLRDNK